jgi:hypothetical protein
VKYVVGQACDERLAKCGGCVGADATRCVNKLYPEPRPGCAVDKYGYAALHDIDRFILDKERTWRSVDQFEDLYDETEV